MYGVNSSLHQLTRNYCEGLASYHEPVTRMPHEIAYVVALWSCMRAPHCPQQALGSVSSSETGLTGNSRGTLALIACVAGLLAAGDAEAAASPELSVFAPCGLQASVRGGDY